MDRTTLVLRLCLIAAVVLACLRPSLPGGRERAPAVQVWDRSASLGKLDAEAGAGSEAWLAVADGHTWVPAGALPEGLGRAATRLGAALHEVARRHPGRDVLLVTDGRATDDALAGARAVVAAGGHVFPRPPRVPAADVGLLEARAEAGPGGASLVVRVGASVRADVRVEAWRAGKRLAALDATLGPGERRDVRLQGVGDASGADGVEVRLVAQPGTPDDDRGNDELALAATAARPRIALLGDVPAAPWGDGVDAEVVRLAHARDAPTSGADLVVLAGQPYAAVGPEGEAALLAYAARGGRVLLLGGPRAYAPGGWGGRELERTLAPLVVRRRPDGEDAIVLALDVSGSTQGEPLTALKQAALAALAALQPGERLAVVPFRAAASAAPLAPGFVAAGDATGAATLARSIEALQAHGPTDLAGGILAGVETLEGAGRSAARRLLLLTDGDPDERPDAQALARVAPRVAALGVGFAALVVGMPAAVDALRAGLAARPEDVQLLRPGAPLAPDLLAQLARQRARGEAERLGGPWAVESSAGGWTGTLPADAAWAALHDVEPATDATVVARARHGLDAARQVAFAAERPVGAGRAFALAWGPALESDPGASWRRLGPLVVALARGADRGLAAAFDDAGRLVVDLPEQAGAGRLELAGEGATLELLEIARGTFRSEGEADGFEHARVLGPGLERVLRLPARPPAEHRGVGVDPARLAALAVAGAGRVLAAHETPPRGPASDPLELGPWFLVLAAILLVVERWRAWRTSSEPSAEPT